MPVVLSYEDIGALGAAAHAAGRAQFAQADQANATALIQNRTARDVAVMQMQQDREQAEANRRLQANIFGAEQGLQQQQLAQQNEQFYAGLAAQQQRDQLGAESDIMSRLLQAQTQAARDQQQHQYNLAEIEARGTQAADGAPINPAGVPSEQQSEREVSQFGNLIPYDTGRAVSGEDANRRRERAAEAAAGFAALPTSELEAYVQRRPSDQWSPYIRAIIQARAGLVGGQTGVGAVPEGNPVNSGPPNPGAGGAPVMPGALQGGGGFGLDTLTDAELDALANDPTMMRRLFGGQ